MKPNIHLNEGVIAEDIFDCWNRIGVWRATGEKCERLDDVIHCCNCKVYSNSGRSLLHRNAPVNYTEEWTARIARKNSTEKSNSVSAILFRLEEEWYLAPVSIIHDITTMRKVLIIPHNKNKNILGVTNVRGEILTCLSLTEILRIDPQHSNTNRMQKKPMLIINNEEYRIALPVNEVKGLTKFNNQDFQFPHDTSKKQNSSILKGIINIEDKHAGIIDGKMLFKNINNILK